MKKLMLFCMLLLFSANSFAELTTDTGYITKIWNKGGYWAVQLDEGMDNALSDRSCRLPWFAYASIDVAADTAALLLFAKANNVRITIESTGCTKNINAPNTFHNITAVFLE